MTKAKRELTDLVADQCYDIDIKTLNRSDIIGTKSTRGKVVWDDKVFIYFTYHTTTDVQVFSRFDPNDLASLNIQGKLTLSYGIHYEHEVHPVIQEIPISTSRQHLGGDRYWMHCPDCLRRVGRLFFPPGGGNFSCRHCYGLCYRRGTDC